MGREREFVNIYQVAQVRRAIQLGRYPPKTNRDVVKLKWQNIQ